MTNINIHLQPNEWDMVKKVFAIEAQSISDDDSDDALKRKEKLIELIERIDRAIVLKSL